jgi:hypothetical protein
MHSSLVTFSFFCNRHFHWLVHRFTHTWPIMGFLRFPTQRHLSNWEKVRDMILIRLVMTPRSLHQLCSSIYIWRLALYSRLHDRIVSLNTRQNSSKIQSMNYWKWEENVNPNAHIHDLTLFLRGTDTSASFISPLLVKQSGHVSTSVNHDTSLLVFHYHSL